MTPLHLACHHGNLEAALILLSQSGIIESNIQDTHGDTPLHQACRYGHEEIVEELLKDTKRLLDVELKLIIWTGTENSCVFVRRF